MTDRFVCPCGSNTFRFDRNTKTLKLICEKCETETLSTKQMVVVSKCPCGKDVYYVQRNNKDGLDIVCTSCLVVALGLGR
jgi:hypothetical protein